MFTAACKLGLEDIASKQLTVPYGSGPSRAWVKVKNPKASAATRPRSDILMQRSIEFVT